MGGRIVYSSVVDGHPKFAYQAWHLARSLRLHCAAHPGDIAIQVTPTVPQAVRDAFRAEGYTVRNLEPFGDRKWCNKIAQIPGLLDEDCDRIVLLDTDMIAVGDIRPFLHGAAVQAKVVDQANPPLVILQEIMTSASGEMGPLMRADASPDLTMVGNANGGLYAIPQPLAAAFQAAWRDWAIWLLAHAEPLARTGYAAHIDQVSAALAFRLSGIPFVPLASNVNYFLHFHGEHHYFDRRRPIALLHYHDTAMDAEGRLMSPPWLTDLEAEAVRAANQQMRTFDQAQLRAAYHQGESAMP